MSASTAGTKRRWVWAAGGAVLIAGALAVLFSLSLSRPPPRALAPPRPKPAIELAERREKSALDEEATLLDWTPLFQPTQWNTARKDVAAPELGGTFQSYRVPAKLGFADAELKLGRIEPTESGANVPASGRLRTSLELSEPVVVPRKPAEALADGLPGSLAVGFGRIDRPVVALPIHGAVVEIVTMGSGRAALPAQAMAQVQALAAAAKPPKPPAGREWNAMEFFAAVDAGGLVAPPAITTRSGVEEIDSYFQNFLARTLRVGERLAPGFYRISVGP